MGERGGRKRELLSVRYIRHQNDFVTRERERERGGENYYVRTMGDILETRRSPVLENKYIKATNYLVDIMVCVVVRGSFLA